MNETLSTLRAAWRLARVALHLALGAAILLCAYPLIGQHRRLAHRQRWSRRLLEILGVGLEVRGTAFAAMRIANHVSWLDVFAINAAAPAAFVAKDDVRDWPLIGWMSSRSDTVYISRGSRRSAHDTSRELTARLAQGIAVVAFPEGTTSDGHHLLPFHAALLQAAISVGLPIQPIALHYSQGELKPAQAPVFCGDTTLAQSLWRIAAAEGLSVHLEFLALRETAGSNRRELATSLRHDILAVMPWSRVQRAAAA